MNADPTLQFALLATVSLLAVLLVFDLMGGATTTELLAFAPAIVWAMVLALKIRR